MRPRAINEEMTNEFYQQFQKTFLQATCALDDSRTAVFSDLHDAELRAMNFKGAGEAGIRNCAPNGLFVVESASALACALQANIEPFAVLIDEDYLSSDEGALCIIQVLSQLFKRFPHTPVFVANTEQFCKITGYPKSRGMLIACKRPPVPTAPELLNRITLDGVKSSVCVVENVTNYTNMAAIFTSAAAFGIDGIFITPSCYDPWYRRCIRASKGAVFAVPWASFEVLQGQHWSTSGIAQLHDAGFVVCAMALKEDALPIQDVRLKAYDKLACIVGTEGEGLDTQTIAACDYTVIIPMAGGVDSLNVAAASAVAFWELG